MKISHATWHTKKDKLIKTSRKKRVIKVSGVAVFPHEIEEIISHIPGVRGVCAIQIPDARLQNAIKIFVVAKFFDEEGMRDLIMETCKKYLIRWSVPKEIEFCDSSCLISCVGAFFDADGYFHNESYFPNFLNSVFISIGKK